MAEILRFKSASDVDLAALPSEPYFAIVSADFGSMPSDEMNGLADLLVATNAMWVAAHGTRSTLFDDAVDFAFVDRDMNAENDLPMVMTTWHDHESIEDVADILATMTPAEEWGVKAWSTIIIRIES